MEFVYVFDSISHHLNSSFDIISVASFSILIEICPFLAKNPPLWIINLNFSDILLLMNVFCTFLLSFKHITPVKVNYNYISAASLWILTEKCPFLAKNPPLWIFNLNFSYIFLFSNPFCTCLPNFKHIPFIKVKL